MIESFSSQLYLKTDTPISQWKQKVEKVPEMTKFIASFPYLHSS